LHDWASHPADAFRMLAVGMESIAPTTPIIKLKIPDYAQQRGAWML